MVLEPEHTRSASESRRAAISFRKACLATRRGGRKVSKSLSSILAQMGRQRVKVNINGKVCYISLLEAVIRQLSNKAANGDLKAIRELLVAHRIFAEPEPPTEASESFHERDMSVLKNIIDRIRRSDVTSATDLKQSSETKEAE
jgi:hypothetical protein